jgi:uncharacterized membrane protein YeiH
MDVLTWIGVLVLALIGGMVGGAIGANITTRQTVAAANDKERRQLRTTAAGLVAVTGEVAQLRDMLKAGRG